jgi:tetratricopeptide (TPR) repeat protein
MKILIPIFVLVLASTAFAQSAKEYFQSGLEKHQKQDYSGAISDYSKAIAADKGYHDAYYNRAGCELAMKDYDAAMTDYAKTIELDPKFARVYYSRATAYLSKEKYDEALADLNKAIELDETVPHALTLRGQMRLQSENTKGACEDFTKAKAIGDPQADKFIGKYCSDDQHSESVKLNWPEDEHWKIGSEQDNAEQHVVDYIHDNETLQKWTEIGNMTSIKGATGVPMDKAMQLMLEESKKNSDDVKLTFIEKDEKAEYPWITFMLEASSFKTDKTPESQLWYVVQGKNALYTNFRAIKQATIPSELKEKWVKFFKTAKVVTK